MSQWVRWALGRAGFHDVSSVTKHLSTGRRQSTPRTSRNFCDRAYAEYLVCLPAQVALVTGMKAAKTGMLANGQFIRSDCRECGVRTCSELLNVSAQLSST